MKNLSMERLFAVFGMFMVILGVAGGRRVKIAALEVGPLHGIWRTLSMVLGLVVLAAVGWLSFAG